MTRPPADARRRAPPSGIRPHGRDILRINREAVVAVILLLFSGVFFAATFTIRQTSYGTIGSELWPRIVILVLAVFTAVHLVASVRRGDESEGRQEPTGAGVGGFLATHRNPIWCFAIFALFLWTLPYLGMLIGGVLFVFVLLTAVGGRDARSLVLHAAISLGAVGAMWAVFTFALHVILPEGEILRFW